MYPEAFLNRMKNLLDSEYDAFFATTKEEPCRGLRLNTRKVDKTRFLSESPFCLSPISWEDNGFYYEESDAPGKHPYHDAGLYYIQEPSAMSAVPHLKIKPGEKVLDLCAAPGGKSTQIACALKGEGLLVTNEIHPARSKILASNIERLGVTNAIVCNETPDHLAEFFPDYFDKILVDAPCSGEGMFRKNPDAILEWSEENVALCADRQDEVLLSAAKMLAPGGRLVYSTCTFSTEENEGTMERFLSSHPDFTLLLKKRLFPHKVRGEGHFVAVLQRNGTPAVSADALSPWTGTRPAKKKPKKETAKDGPQKKAPALFLDFAAETFTDAGLAFLQDIKHRAAGYLLFGDQLYFIMDNLPPLTGIKVARPGFHLGTLKKDRFEPSHGLALALTSDMVKRSVSFPSEGSLISAYLEGQAISPPDEDFSLSKGQKGWCLVLVDGYSLSWGKLSGGLLKNHYPKGLRRK